MIGRVRNEACSLEEHVIRGSGCFSQVVVDPLSSYLILELIKISVYLAIEMSESEKSRDPSSNYTDSLLLLFH